jgi:hypothetical protein
MTVMNEAVMFADGDSEGPGKGPLRGPRPPKRALVFLDGPMKVGASIRLSVADRVEQLIQRVIAQQDPLAIKQRVKCAWASLQPGDIWIRAGRTTFRRTA